MVFPWSLSNSKSPQVPRTLISILSVLNNAVVWMVSTLPPTFKSSYHFNNPLVTVPKALITIGIIVTIMFHSLFVFLIPEQGRGTYPSLPILSVLFCGQPRQKIRQYTIIIIIIVVFVVVVVVVVCIIQCMSIFISKHLEFGVPKLNLTLRWIFHFGINYGTWSGENGDYCTYIIFCLNQCVKNVSWLASKCFVLGKWHKKLDKYVLREKIYILQLTSYPQTSV